MANFKLATSQVGHVRHPVTIVLDMAYYKLSFVDKRVESPEQIFSNDVPRLCESLSDILQDLLCAITDGSFFTWRLAVQTSPSWAAVSWLYVVVAVCTIACPALSPETISLLLAHSASPFSSRSHLICPD